MKNKMEIKVEENIKLKDGEHTGVIINIESREKPYNYIDVLIQPKEAKITMKAGFPAYINNDSKLGLLLKRFGKILTVGEIVRIEDILIGKPITFITITTPNKNGKTYANIIPESIKPTEEVITIPLDKK